MSRDVEDEVQLQRVRGWLLIKPSLCRHLAVPRLAGLYKVRNTLEVVEVVEVLLYDGLVPGGARSSHSINTPSLPEQPQCGADWGGRGTDTLVSTGSQQISGGNLRLLSR